MTTSLTSRPDVDLLDPHFHVGDPHPLVGGDRDPHQL